MTDINTQTADAGRVGETPYDGLEQRLMAAEALNAELLAALKYYASDDRPGDGDIARAAINRASPSQSATVRG
jgi:hypothetical protein